MQNWLSNFQLLSFQSSNFQFCHFSLLSINFYQCSPLLELSYFFLLSDQNYTVLTFILIIIFIVKRKINKKAVKKKKKKKHVENGKRKSKGNWRSLNELERVDMNEGWSEQVRNPTRCLHFSNSPSPWHPHTPLRSASLQNLCLCSQPLCLRHLRLRCKTGFHFCARYLHDRGGDGLCQIGFEACGVPLACCLRTPLLATFHLGLRFRFMNWTSPTCSRFWFLR